MNATEEYKNVIVKTEIKYEFKDAEFITNDMMFNRKYVVGIDIRGEIKKTYLSEDGTMQERC